MLSPVLESMRLCAITWSMESDVPFDTPSVLGYARDIARSIPAVQYIGLQTNEEFWEQFHYQWFRVVSRPERDPPVLETLSAGEADILELDLLAMQRD